MRNKIGAAFVTGASISNGTKTTMQSVHAAMLINQMGMVSGGGAFGASATTGPDCPGVDEGNWGLHGLWVNVLRNLPP
jgi:NAD(P)H dehydrogenase (quinone)